MSEISVYDIVPTPKLADKLIGTSVGGVIPDVTYNFTLEELLQLFIPNLPANNLQGVLDYGNTATQNINLTGTINTTDLNVFATASILDSILSGETHITGELYDGLDSKGTAGQVLRSTGSGVEWYTVPTVIPTLQQVLTSGNTADKNIILTANITAVTATATNVVSNTSLAVNGILKDGTASAGGSNQILSSTGSGVQWVDMPVYNAVSPLLYDNPTKTFSIQVANSTEGGYLTSSDWITFDGKQDPILLTTTGTSGASTFIGNTLNIPIYTPDLSGYVPTSRTLTINGITYDLSANRSWTIPAGVAEVTATSPLFSTGGAYPDISIQIANTSQDGYLSATDWNTFNAKQGALTLTTTGTSGPSTLVGDTLNIPQYQPVLVNPITGLGTTNYVSKFTAASVLGNSNIQDDGSLITLGSDTTISSGSLAIGAANFTGSSLRVGKNITGVVTSYGVLADGSVDSDVTTALNYASVSKTSAASFTLSTYNHFYAIQGTFGAGSTVTTQQGFVATSTLIGATTNIGFRGDIPSGTGRWNLYMGGTAINYMSGALLIGTTTDSGYKLDVAGSTNISSSNFYRYNGNTGIIGSGSSISGGTVSQLGIRAASDILFATNGANERMRIDLLGSVGIGATSLTGYSLRVSKNITGATTAYGVSVDGVIQSDVTTSPYGYNSNLSTAAASFAINTLYHYRAQQGTIGAGSSVSLQIGFDVANTLTGATTNIGFRSQLNSGTNRWNLYMAGTANNYLAGNLLIGSTTDNGIKLQVTGQGYFSGAVGIGTTTLTGLSLAVVGLTRFTGTTASDTAPLGAELAAVTGTGTNWTLAGTDLNNGGYTHTVGSVVPLTTSLVAVSGTYYQIAYTITGRTAGSITIAYGGTSTSISATGITGPLASSTSVLTITPTTDFDGTVALSIKSIGTSSASSIFANSTGGIPLEIRASSVTSNTFIGTNAGRRVLSGIAANTFIGSNAGAQTTSGGNNTFIGNVAGQNTSTGSNNVFIGASAGQNNTVASSNVFIGSNSGSSNTTGSGNAFLGNAAGQLNSTGSNNANFGNSAGSTNTTGSGNTLFGNNAGRYIADGVTAATVLNQSILIGYNTRVLADSQINQIVIGYGTTGLGSNTTVLGNSSTTLTALYGAVITGGTSVNASAQLQVDSTTKGFLPPRMTAAQRIAIASPATGLIVFQTDGVEGLWLRVSTGWVELTVV